MLHIRNTTHKDGESMVMKANRKHQIVLNMEVKRIEMEKKMRERYFCFWNVAYEGSTTEDFRSSKVSGNLPPAYHGIWQGPEKREKDGIIFLDTACCYGFLSYTRPCIREEEDDFWVSNEASKLRW